MAGGRRSRTSLAFFLSAATLLAAVTAYSQQRGGARRGNLPMDVTFDFAIPPAPVLSPAEEMATFQIAEGYGLQLIASEPMIVDPIALTIDPDGRLWVCEMRGFMTDIDNSGENDPVGTITILEDTDGDSVMDNSTLFLDGLIAPRSVCWTLDGLLLAGNGTIWLCRDENGDLKCDSQEKICDYIPGNLEHALNGLLPSLDNWYYNAKEGLRLRKLDGRWVTERIADRGQWGITQDDHGYLYYNYNAQLLRGDLLPVYSQSVLAANPLVNVELYAEQEVFPIRPTPGINRGYDPSYLRPDGSMIQANADCGPVVFRGDNLPAELRGNVFIPEPAGNLVRRQVIVEENGTRSSRNAYDKREFLASTDERFRPVNMYNAPDGTMYLIDMYRGILQHAPFMTDFLANQIRQRDLDKHIHLGRIYRVVHETTARRDLPRLTSASGPELVALLSSPNGWHRDMSQQLLVQRGDRSVVPALEELAQQGTDPLGRLHAVWTLEGLGQVDPDVLFDLLRDNSAPVRASAATLYARLLNARPEVAFLQELQPLASDPDPLVRMQAALAVGLIPGPIADELVERFLASTSDQPDRQAAFLAAFAGKEVEFLAARFSSPGWSQESPQREAMLSALGRTVWQQRDPLAILRLFHFAEGLSGSRQLTLFEGLATPAGRGGRRGVGGGRRGGGGQAPAIRLPSPPEGIDSLLTSPNPQLAAAAMRVAEQLVWPGKNGQPLPERPALSAEQQALYDLGRREYLNLCAACHHPAGYGDAAKGPPLLGSDWLARDEQLLRIVLNGLRGPVTINDEPYNLDSRLSMPALSKTLDDEKIAGILTYVRREFHENAGPITPAVVSAMRPIVAPRTEPWTESELRDLR